MDPNKKSTARRNNKIVFFIAQAIKNSFFFAGTFKQETILSILAEKLIPVTHVSALNGKIMKFWGFGGWPLYRGRSVLTKEPLTIKWIDSFDKEDVLWDIGANVGVYSIYAGAAAGLQKVFSFEPSLSNIAVFSKNIELNGLSDVISAFPVALSDKSGLDYLSMITTTPGNTGGQFAHDRGRESDVFKQATLGFSIDDFIEIYNIPAPNHIKMDVDGIEPYILKGGSKTLKSEHVKSIILETDINSEDYKKICTILIDECGFREGESEATVKGREHMRNIIYTR